MSGKIEGSFSEAYNGYVRLAIQAAKKGDFQGAVRALHLHQERPLYQERLQEEFDHACQIVAGVFTKTLTPDDPQRIEMHKKIKAEVLILYRKERGIPNFSDETFRNQAIQSAKAKHCGSAAILADQIQDLSIQQETRRSIAAIIGNMSPTTAYNQGKAFLLGIDDWEKTDYFKL